jgi:transcriptional regulator with GAF, ATPase, and Fis domain
VNVRIIAATNKNLLNEVKANRFRDDLFYRLNVFPIHIAPLNARKEDIPLLAAHFICKLSKRLNVQPPRLTQANVLDLQAYAWPGNVRELENAIERAIILTRSNFLNFNSLKESSPPAAASPVGRVVNIDVDNKIFSAEELSQLERQNTINALRQCKWKIYGDGGAANLLGIKPTTLIERIKRMRIQKPGKNLMNTNHRAAPVE